MDRHFELIQQIGLTLVIICLLLVNLVPAWAVYQSRLSIKTDKPSGSSLAERYLILGDWPADSELASVIKDNQNYIVTSAVESEASTLIKQVED
ncbi:hypothetical protein [Shewanella sp. UCD-KL12]|uniref:hypothetical protein n=1 Tax=Shewanella sp. UCD-KL12 TaxID=1917163 RepID=UPI000970962C|nr:hypothetical protein [Shewanella sp. UCD-KL12]